MTRFSTSEVARLRTAVDSVEREIARVPLTERPNDLRGSWDALVHQLDLGPVPEQRVCPVCGHTGMRAASVCGYCWTKLEPYVEAR